MKLLLDENLSRRLLRRLDDVFPGSRHVTDLGLGHSDDDAIWKRAVADGFVILSKDDDFRQRCLLRGAPPKVIWIKVGNCSTDEIEAFLRTKLDEIAAFEGDPVTSLLIVP